jgi:hypothetical protein
MAGGTNRISTLCPRDTERFLHQTLLLPLMYGKRAHRRTGARATPSVGRLTTENAPRSGAMYVQAPMFCDSSWHQTKVAAFGYSLTTVASCSASNG